MCIHPRLFLSNEIRILINVYLYRSENGNDLMSKCQSNNKTIFYLLLNMGASAFSSRYQKVFLNNFPHVDLIVHEKPRDTSKMSFCDYTDIITIMLYSLQ